MSKQYVIAGGDAGWRRLRLLARTMATTTRAHLVDAGVREGMTCIDVGCGGGHVTQTLAEMVGPSGHVVGIDFDAVKLAAAAAEVERAGLRNIEFRTADVLTWREPSTYDVVFGRFILSHLPESARVLANMRDALRAGVVVVLEDIDFQADSAIRPMMATGATPSCIARWCIGAAAMPILESACTRWCAKPVCAMRTSA